MPDREKVIGHLNDCMEASRRDNTWVFVRKDIVADALALLKEQDANHKPDCEHAEHDSVGFLGYCGCTQDDEPIEACKRCEKYTGNVYEAVMLK